MNARSLLVALLALFVGLGSGFQLSKLVADEAEAAGRGGTVAPPTNDVLAGAKPAAPSARATDVVATAPLPERGDAAAEVEPDAPKVTEAQFAGARRSIAAPEIAAPSGDGTITGSVRDRDGAPMAGVTVIAQRNRFSRWSDPSYVGQAAPEDTSLDDALRSAADSWAESRAAKRRVLTGADGTYALAGIAPGESYRVTAYREGYTFDAPGSQSRITAGSVVDFTAERVFSFEVRLAFASGGVPDEGVIAVKRGNSSSSYRWTPDAPELRLTGGPVEVRAYAGVDTSDAFRGDVVSQYASEKTELDAAERGDEPLALVLEPRTGVRGRIVGPLPDDNRPQAHLLQVPDASKVDLEQLASSNQSCWISTDRFQFLDLAPGTYAVGLASWGESVLAYDVVEVASGIVDVDLAIPEPDPDHTLLVDVLDPAGKPLRDVDFQWTSRSGNGSRSGGIGATPDAGGAYVLRPKEDFFEPWPSDASYTLTVTHDRYGSRAIDLAEGQRKVDVRFDEPVAIVLVVGNYPGSDYVGRLTASVSRPNEDRHGFRRTFFGGRSSSSSDGIGVDGVQRFEHLEPGDWRVTLNVKVGQWQMRAVATQDVKVLSGEKTVRLDVPPLYEVRAYAPGLSEGARLSLRETSEGGSEVVFSSSSSESLDADHRAVFELVPAGSYELSGPGMSKPIDVTVPCGEVLVEANEPNALRVSIGDLEGRLYKSGLRAGDVIVGADGKRFEGVSHASSVFQGDEPIELIVVRGGGEIVVTVPGGLYAGGGDPGGVLTPTEYP